MSDYDFSQGPPSQGSTRPFRRATYKRKFGSKYSGSFKRPRTSYTAASKFSANPATGTQVARPRPSFSRVRSQLAKYILSVVNKSSEPKYKQTTTNTVGNTWVIKSSSTIGVDGATPGTATPGFYGQWVPYPDRGDDYSERDGREIRMRGIQLKGVCACYSSNAYEGGQATFYIVEVTQTGELADTNPADWIGAIWGVDVNGEYSSSCLRRRETNDQVRILAQQTVKIFPGAESSAEINLYANLKDIAVKFNGSSGSNFETRAYFCYGLVNGRNAGTSTISQPKLCWSGSLRVSFVDN